MAWKINDISLGESSAIESAHDSSRDLALNLAVTPQERRLLQELAENAGAYEEVQLPDGRVLIVDLSPNGENTLYITSHAPGQVEEGWFVWDDIRDDVGRSPSHARMQANLKRIGGPHDVEGVMAAMTEFLQHDF